MSCGAACWRQLLLDQGITVDESVLRDEAGYDETYGIVLEYLLEAMQQRCPSWDYAGGTIDPAEVTFVKPPFIVVMKKHYQIVDSLDAHSVSLRDPAPAHPNAPTGSEVTMARRDFDDAWRGGIIYSRSKG